MKNKKDSSSQEKLFLKRVDSETIKNRTEVRIKKKSVSNSLLQKTNHILQTYNALFRKPSFHFGDADTYFKQTLRNYDDFDFLKAPKCDTKLRTTYSRESFKDSKKAKQSISGDGDKVAKEEKSHFQQATPGPEETEENRDSVTYFSEDEQEAEEFYSPSGEPLLLADIKEVEETDTANKLDMDEEDEIPQDEDVTQDYTAEEGDSTQQDYEDYDVTERDLAEEEEMESELSKVQEMIEHAETELKEVEKAPDQPEEGTAKQEISKNLDDNALMKELEEAEKEAQETAKIIFELKERLAQLLTTEVMSDAEAKELEDKNRLLRDHMLIFEEKTKRIQYLVQQKNWFDKEEPDKEGRPSQVAVGTGPVSSKRKNKEDMLPKVIVCGTTESNMPQIIVCNDKKKKEKKSSYPLPTQPPVCVPHFAKKLSESYFMQEKLAAENADLEGTRYRLQEDLLNKDQTVESLQKKLHGLQTEMRMICKENLALSEKLEKYQNLTAPSNKGDSSGICTPRSQPQQAKMPCGKGKATCPADVETRLNEYSETTHQLEAQLGEMENEVRTMQQELVAVQKERQHLEHHRKMLCIAPPCPPSPCPPPPCPPAPCAPPPCHPPPMPPCPAPCNPNLRMGISSDQALRELREQYNRLQDDFKAKLTEVAGLRAENEKNKQTAKESEEAKKLAEDKLKELERELKQYRNEKDKYSGSKEQLIEQEQQLNVAKQRFREAQDELEELRALIQDQQSQLDDYRNKYLQAQQQVEEQRRQIDMMEMENNRIAEQVNLEIQRVKNQFQEKLQELTPLPDILKATQLKLQEAQQMHLMAEKNNESLVRELQAFKDRAAEMANQLDQQRSDQLLGADQNATLQSKLEEWEKKCNELQEENDALRAELARVEEVAQENQKKVQEKVHEIVQLSAQLETVREESARQVARTKDRCETIRRSMQNQIADLERQVAQNRAQAKAAQHDRDEIRQKMQAQINNLNENFEDAQMRIRNLQGHVNFLKNSYTNVFPPDPAMAMAPEGLEGCDCGHNF